MSSEWDPIEREWGPKGLETPATVPVNRGLLVVTALSLACTVGVPWCQHSLGSIDLMTGDRQCATAPSEIRAWSFHNNTRRPEDGARLQEWIARHPGRINNQYGAFCDTPLHLAAEFGREDLAGPLIDAGADLEAVNELNDRPLHTAATYGHPAVVQLLLARGANVNARDPWGKTPLHAAAGGLGGQSNIEGRIRVARLLLAAGAEVNARLTGSGFTPLRSATSYESANAVMAELLLSHGADPSGAEEPPPGPRAR